MQLNPTLPPNITNYDPQQTLNVKITTYEYSYIFKNRYTQIHCGIEMATYLWWKSRPHPNQIGDKQPQN